MKKILSLLMIISFMPLLMGAQNYNYSYWGTAIHSAPGMTYIASINSQSLSATIESEEEFTLSSPEDLVVYEDTIYLVDKNENSLVLINQSFELVQDAIKVFDYSQVYLDKLMAEGITDETNTELKEPYGVDVTESGIFICDTGNYRIIKLNHDYEVVDIFSEIEEETFDEVMFEPIKITVDPTDRMYVVAKNIYEGILEINSDGTFNRFTGVNPINLTPLEIFRRSLMTEEQIAQLQLFLPTEYTNVNINDSNFIYATSKVSENNAENPIQLINPKGVDVIKRNGYFPPMGDIQYVEGMNNYVIDGPSQMVDIAYTDDGIYTVLDQKRSRLFTYDSEGNLLYIDGDEGRQTDKFSEGVAIDYLGDDLLVLDRRTKSITVYGLTEFGNYVNLAIHYHNEGMFEEAALVWEKVVQINSNYEIAYNGIGKLMLRQENYEEAMEYFKLGHDQYYYSKAYREYRNNIIKANFGYIMGGIVLITGTLIGLKIRKIYKKGGTILYED
jgi:tetratricopeptide (TPR) repeat protein